ncbi:MAG: hypothetical protein IJZ63_02370 [Clostridia bacterium]|nr:hypothetical protein [Clostridia bacterium]
MTMAVVSILAAITALAAAILAFIFIVPEKRRVKLNQFGKFLHDLCNFKFLIIEKILQFCYVLATAFSIAAGFFMLFAVEKHYSYSYYGGGYSYSEWIGYYGFIVMILGPIAVRIGYELMMMALLAVKNIIQINNKLKNQNEETADADPFTAPTVTEYIPQQQPVVNAFCPNCGTPKAPDEFCPNCGQK